MKEVEESQASSLNLEERQGHRPCSIVWEMSHGGGEDAEFSFGHVVLGQTDVQMQTA